MVRDPRHLRRFAADVEACMAAGRCDLVPFEAMRPFFVGSRLFETLDELVEVYTDADVSVPRHVHPAVYRRPALDVEAVLRLAREQIFAGSAACRDKEDFVGFCHDFRRVPGRVLGADSEPFWNPDAVEELRKAVEVFNYAQSTEVWFPDRTRVMALPVTDPFGVSGSDFEADAIDYLVRGAEGGAWVGVDGDGGGGIDS